jgi:hypothetical protein
MFAKTLRNMSTKLSVSDMRNAKAILMGDEIFPDC